VNDVDISLAGGWIEVGYIVHPPGEVVVSMRPVSVFANGTGSEIEKLQASLSGQWRQATREGWCYCRCTGYRRLGSLSCWIASSNGAPLIRPVQRRRDGRAGRSAPVRAASAGPTLADRPDRRDARAPGPVDTAADPSLPGLAVFGYRAGSVTGRVNTPSWH
jgi:hypothetical protein